MTARTKCSNEGLSPRVRGNLKHAQSEPNVTRSIPACAGEPLRETYRHRPREVYPRVCGGTIDFSRTAAARKGLSPRVRGNPPPSRRNRICRGSIPACAGEPWTVARTTRRWRVYPRVCGGTYYRPGLAGVRVGLSPRVRGNPMGYLSTTLSSRSIPACAGEPAGPIHRLHQHAVYPRVCGGTPLPHIGARVAQGLSPRVRGNRLPCPGRPHTGRSIPACAGEPQWQAHCRRWMGVYPRVCGGTLPALLPPCSARGLSPRVRGNRSHPPFHSGHSGSIPACAGEPAPSNSAGLPVMVYPRVCGGTNAGRRYPFANDGLSPRVRGNRVCAILGGTVAGSIPACAGEPGIKGDLWNSSTVYPRVCGGTRNAAVAKSWPQGLSPRVRGNPNLAIRGGTRSRSIPACAGEPR